MRLLILALAVLAAACGDDPVAPPDEPFRLTASFASEPIFVQTVPLGDVYGALRFDFTEREEADTLPPANPTYLGEPIVDVWRYRIHDGDTVHAELDRGYYSSPDGGVTIFIEGVGWLHPVVEADGPVLRARATWINESDHTTFVDVNLRRR